jgi:threonine aldolase
VKRLRDQGWHFYSFIGTGEVRFMCSWATAPREIEELVSAVRQAMKSA